MERKLFNKLPIIETDNLMLRKFKLKYAKDYYRYHSTIEANRFYDWMPDTLKDAVEDIRGIKDNYKTMNSIIWAITLKDNDTIIGDCGLINDVYKGEINYMLAKEYWGSAIMTEALGALISFLFSETGLQRIQALTQPGNKPSIRLLERLGFTCEGVLRKYGFNTITNQIIDLSMWSLLKEEFGNYSYYKVLSK